MLDIVIRNTASAKEVAEEVKMKTKHYISKLKFDVILHICTLHVLSFYIIHSFLMFCNNFNEETL